MIQVVIADDHAIIREGLRALLETQADIRVTGAAANGRELIHLVAEKKPDVIIVDLSMPELNGIDAIEQILANKPSPKVVVLSIHATRPYVFRAVRAGANAYLLKETAGLEVVQAIRAVLRGEHYLSHPIAESLWQDLRGKLKTAIELSPLDRLSGREREVLQLVAEGKTSQEIAGLLSITAKSVDTYRSRLMQKIGVSDIASLVRFAIQQGVIQLD